MPMKLGDPVPGFEGATEWLQGSRDEAEELSGNGPLLVHFWSVGCGICKEKMPFLQDLLAKYGPGGLSAVAVHMPRYESETEVDGVRAMAVEIGIAEICAIDNLHRLRNAFQNEQGWVPVYYLFDGEGRLKTRAAGEFGVGIVKSALEKMFDAEHSKTSV